MDEGREDRRVEFVKIHKIPAPAGRVSASRGQMGDGYTPFLARPPLRQGEVPCKNAIEREPFCRPFFGFPRLARFLF